MANGGLRRRMAAIVLPLTGGKKIWGSGRHTYTHRHTKRNELPVAMCAVWAAEIFFFFFAFYAQTMEHLSVLWWVM